MESSDGFLGDHGRRHDAFARTFTESSSGMGAATDPLTSDTVTSFVVTCARVLTSRGFRSAFSVATARRSRRRRTVVARFADASRAGDVTAGDRRARVAPRGDPATAVAPDVASVAANISRVSCACECHARRVTRNSPDYNMWRCGFARDEDASRPVIGRRGKICDARSAKKKDRAERVIRFFRERLWARSSAILQSRTGENDSLIKPAKKARRRR